MSNTTLIEPSRSKSEPAGKHGRFFVTTHLRRDMGRRVIRGAASISIGQGSQFILSLTTTGILARMLAPADFGLVAMTAVVTSFLLIFKDAGLTSATIQRESLSHEQVSTLFWVNAGAGLLIAMIMVASAPLVAGTFGDPRLTQITRSMAIPFIFGGLTVQHQALMRRQMRFKSLAARGVVAMLVGSTVGIGLAFAGAGYWSLVGMAVANSVASMVTVWLAVPWIPGRPRWCAETWSMLRFGSDILISDISTFLCRKVDSLLIGIYWGPVALGLYERAYALLMSPVKQINRPLAGVFVPTLSRLSDNPAERRRYFLHGLETVASVFIPVILAIATFADAVVMVWLGPKWMECAHLFQLMSVAALFGGISTPLGWLQVSTGQTRRYRQLAIATSALLVLAFAAGLPWGPRGVATAYSIMVIILSVPTWHYGLKGTAVTLLDAGRTMGVPLAAGIPAAGMAWLAMHLLVDFLPEWQSAAAGLLVFAAVYASLLLGAFRRLDRLREIFRTLRKQRAVTAGSTVAPATPAA